MSSVLKRDSSLGTMSASYDSLEVTESSFRDQMLESLVPFFLGWATSCPIHTLESQP